MSFTTSNLVAVSNGNNNNNVIAASNGESFIAAVSGLIGTESPFTGAKFFKGAAPGTIKKPSARVAGMKTTVGFDGFTGVNAQVGKLSSSLRNKIFWLLSQKPLTPPRLGPTRPSNRLEGWFPMNRLPNLSFPPLPAAMVAAQSIYKMLLQQDKLIIWLM